MKEESPFFDEPARQKQFEAWEYNAEQRRYEYGDMH